LIEIELQRKKQKHDTYYSDDIQQIKSRNLPTPTNLFMNIIRKHNIFSTPSCVKKISFLNDPMKENHLRRILLLLPSRKFILHATACLQLEAVVVVVVVVVLVVKGKS
jgi:hypothetical protein